MFCTYWSAVTLSVVAFHLKKHSGEMLDFRIMCYLESYQLYIEPIIYWIKNQIFWQFVTMPPGTDHLQKKKKKHK